MGLVPVTAELESQSGLRAERQFMIDTGSFYSAITPDLQRELQLPRGFPAQSMVADGRIVDTELVFARIRLQDRVGVVPVEVADVPQLLIGASTLEALGFKVNPVTEKLEYERPYQEPPRFTLWRV
jgi:predicted aspartyl protease